MKMYRKVEPCEAYPEGIESCDVELDQRDTMKSAGFTMDPSGEEPKKEKKKKEKVFRFICDECGAGYDEKPDICTADDCESESFTDAIPTGKKEKAATGKAKSS